MNSTFNTKPHFQAIIDRQRLAQHHLTKSTMSRTAVELAHFERHLSPCPVSDVELPKVPLVRLSDRNLPDSGKKWALLGEIAQVPGKVILLDLETGKIELSFPAETLEMVPPNVI